MMKVLIVSSKENCSPSQSLFEHISGAYSNFEDLHVKTASETYDVIIIDFDYGNQSFVEFVCKSKDNLLQSVVLVRFTKESFSDELLGDMLRAGVDGYVIGNPSVSTISLLYNRLSGEQSALLSDGRKSTLCGDVVSGGKKAVKVTKKESALLKFLLQNEQEILCHQLGLMILGYKPESKTNTFRSTTHRLRQKLVDAGFSEVIQTKTCGGYYIARANGAFA